MFILKGNTEPERYKKPASDGGILNVRNYKCLKRRFGIWKVILTRCRAQWQNSLKEYQNKSSYSKGKFLYLKADRVKRNMTWLKQKMNTLKVK